MAAGEVGDDQPFVGPQPALDDVLADEFVNGRAGTRSADGIDANRWFGFENAHGFDRLTPPGNNHPLRRRANNAKRKECTISID